MNNPWLLSPARRLTEEERSLVWHKPATHIESEIEQRIRSEVKRNWNHRDMKITNILLEGDAGSGKTQLAKALSANFGLPYTKITCFADMDKSDVLGSVLPILSDQEHDTEQVTYRFYPSEIVRAYEHGWLLEIQEPTVIRDAAVLMALNSALEPDGYLNLPTRVVHRHPDFITVITTNRGYNGCRPLNESLRDRVQHAEKMDLPPKQVMIERAAMKTHFHDNDTLSLMAETIILLDKTAQAHAIKGVAGMRSYLFWVDAVANGAVIRQSLYHKVIYKMTTDPVEISILEQALSDNGLTEQMNQLQLTSKQNPNSDIIELHLSADGEYFCEEDQTDDELAIRLRKSTDCQGQSDQSSDQTIETESSDLGEEGAPIYHERDPVRPSEQEKRDFRRKLNQEARQSVIGTCHENIKLIVHRAEITEEHRAEYKRLSAELMPVIRELIRTSEPLLEHEISNHALKSQLYGTTFCADKLAAKDFRYFARKRPPEERPSLAVALRLDESASMEAFGRLDAAKRAAVALYEFCRGCGIPVLIYGDSADRSRLEQMSIYSYVDGESKDPDEKYSLMGIQSWSNNRDGMALRIVADRLLKTDRQTKLFISLSDGQPKAMPDYTGNHAIADMKQTLQEYRRKGILFLAAAIGQDKEMISEIYGSEHTLDISDLRSLPARLAQIIARHL